MKKAFLALAFVVTVCGHASATVFWDTNGTTAGSGVTPNGTWSASSATWGNTGGTAAPAVYGADKSVRFSAGTDAVNPYTVTVVGTVNVTAMGLEEGTAFTITGGVINFDHAANATSILTGVTTGIPTSVTIDSQISSNANVGFKIARNLGLTNFVSISNTANNWTGPTQINGDNTLKLLASGVIPDASAVGIAAATAGGVLDLNGFDETIAGASSSNASAKITLGSGKLTIGAPAGETFTGVISGTNGKVVKNGTGQWNLTNANTFTGGFTLGAGTIGVDSTTALGAASSAVTINGGTLTTVGATNRTETYAFTVGGNFTLGQAVTGTGVVTMAGTVDLGGATRQITVDNATDTISGAISNGGITKAGTGILALTSVNTYSGPTTVNAGAVSVNATATLGDGTGALNLSGGNLIITQNRTVTTQPIANPISMTASAAITTSSTANTVNVNFTSNSISGSAGTLTFRNDGADAISDVFDPRFSGSGFNFTQQIVIDNGIGTTRLSSFNTTGTTQTFSGVVSGNGSFRRSASSSGTGGDTVFTGNNTYSGGTELNDGLIGLGSSTDAGLTKGPVGTGAITVGSSNNPGLYAFGGAQVVKNAIVMSSGGMQFTGSNKLEMSGTVGLGAVNRTLLVTNTADTILSGVISDTGGTGAITKTGGGVLILSGANTYGGGTTVSTGTLAANNTTGSATGTGSVTVNAGATLAGNGFITGAVTVNGTLSPGNSIDSLDTGALTFGGTGSSMTYQMATASAVADLVNAAGSLLINVGSALNVTDVPTAQVSLGTKYTVISYSGSWISGNQYQNAFTGKPNGSSFTVGANTWLINYNDTPALSVNGGGYAKAVTLTAVPEASTFLVIGLGGIFSIALVRLGKRMGINVLKA